jgi:hypothetical protein
MRVGPLAYENWDLFTLIIQKPWFHIEATAIGVYAAWLYLQTKKYRLAKEKNDKEALSKFPIIFFIHKHSWIKYLMAFASIVILITCLFISYTANFNAYKWSMKQNILFYAFMKTCYLTSCFLLFFSIIFGGFPLMKAVLTSSPLLALGKVCFEASLLAPMVMLMLMST